MEPDRKVQGGTCGQVENGKDKRREGGAEDRDRGKKGKGNMTGPRH